MTSTKLLSQRLLSLGLFILIVAMLAACSGGAGGAPPVAQRGDNGTPGGGPALPTPGEGFGTRGAPPTLPALPEGTAVAAWTQAAGAVGTAAAAGTQVSGALATAVALASALPGTRLPVTPASVTDAGSVLSTYARDVLGRDVSVLSAGGLSVPIQRVLGSYAGNYAGTAANVAVATYAGTLDGGAASVSYGSGSLSGDFTVDINSASLGSYALKSNAAALPDAAAALALVAASYPALGGLNYQQESGANGAFVFYATGNTNWIDPRTGTVGTTAQAVTAGVSPARGQGVTVWIAVGRGQFSAVVRP